MEKWEVPNILYKGVNYADVALLEQWDFCDKNVDEAQDLLDWLGRDTYEFESSHSNSYIPPRCILNYAHLMCEICCCSDHDSNSCPYHISIDSFARLSSMIETMNER